MEVNAELDTTRRALPGLTELLEHGRMTWLEPEHGWAAVPEEVLAALGRDGFEECKRELTTSRPDSRPAGGVWQGVDTRTSTVASAIWVNRPGSPEAIVFVDVDGRALTEHSALGRARDLYREGG